MNSLQATTSSSEAQWWHSQSHWLPTALRGEKIKLLLPAWVA